MTGRILKSIAGDYWVETKEDPIVCRPRGLFRHEGKKPTVGDMVEVKDATITNILPRKNLLLRPNVANVDKALLVFSLNDPKPDFLTLDALIVNVLYEGIEPVLVFNKSDLVNSEDIEKINLLYSCFSRFFISTLDKESLKGFIEELSPGVYVLAGPSGAGKSSMINALSGKELFVVGALSVKIKRGKHTTRHNELIYLGKDVYLADTPGFQTLDLTSMETKELRQYYPEFLDLDPCRYDDCLHDKEPACGVKKALSEGLLEESRYKNYLALLDKLRSRKEY
ncbi:MAG: ribosome small subunit-dependent GTPase A [Tissierellia bacterium]|nr:ribosome small subunit-dependent GTPase A [Tissierellia bacterium]